MSGRGRGATLPAWMTGGDMTGAVEPSQSNNYNHNNDNYNEVNENHKYQFADDQAPFHQETTIPMPIPAMPTFLISPTNNTPIIPKALPAMPPIPSLQAIMTAPVLSLAPTLNTTFLPTTFRPPPAMPNPSNPMSMIPPFRAPVPSGPPFTSGNPFTSGPPFPSGNIPMPMPSMPMPMMPTFIPTPAPIPNGVTDPNNDASLWKEHVNEIDERKYWFNKVTLISTYEKPFCLKTPEERSIPPCIWKEYTSTTNENGVVTKKKYYSNGTESIWTMPEEFKVWKEKMDHIEAKKKAAILDAANSTGSKKNDNKNNSNNTSQQQQQQQGNQSGGFVAPVEKKVEEPVFTVFGSVTEALEAFQNLLVDNKVAVTAKVKDVQDQFQSDPTYLGVLKLVTPGDRKQVLAEYQTKKVKQEKELQKIKNKKHRDAFLLMLAENTEIDARTRWREAVEVLKDDQRYKNLDDTREREDLFRDFVLELEKKEKEDRKKQKDIAIAFFTKILQERLVGDGGIVNIINLRKLVWAEAKKDYVDIICKPELRELEDSDLRRCFQDFVAELEEAHRKEERRKKDEFQKLLESKQTEVDSLLSQLAKDGVITADSRWKEFSISDSLVNSSVFVDLQAIHEKHFAAISSDKDPVASSLSCCREMFEKVLTKVQEDYRNDKRLLKEVFQIAKVKVSHDTTVQQLNQIVLQHSGIESADSAPSPLKDKEEGEEIEEDSNTLLSKNNVSSLKKLMTERPNSAKIVFEELIEKARQDHEEDLRAIRKQEDKFRNLLDDYFYLSEHINTSWDDAKKILQKRYAYDSVSSKSEKKRLFTEHIEELTRKLEMKKKSMMSLHLSSQTTADDDAKNNNSSDDDNSKEDDEDKHQKSKKAKKEKDSKKDKKHKKHKRDRSSSPPSDSKHHETDKNKRQRSRS